ncbi:GSK3-beta interaction protein [Leptopilina heterotoma]|uniref:GSK3-beta interaction protein n=1 Tax=Leptopilina heterotoma TaxID=63436 RepID=UPI001CAA2186|nr:GSK3-beta interaction protein [Leptopilina heterotoma]
MVIIFHPYEIFLADYNSFVIKKKKFFEKKMNPDERVLDAEQWKLEAQSVINDVKNHVTDFVLSEKFQSTNTEIFLNLTTLENLKFCVKLTAAGFCVVGNQHDDMSNNMNTMYFETPYSLLDFLSPMYRNSFGNSLLNKLNLLKENQTDNN